MIILDTITGKYVLNPSHIIRADFITDKNEEVIRAYVYMTGETEVQFSGDSAKVLFLACRAIAIN